PPQYFCCLSPRRRRRVRLFRRSLSAALGDDYDAGSAVVYGLACYSDNRFLDDRRILGDQLDRPIALRGDDRLRIDAEQMIQRPAETLDLVELVRHLAAGLVGRADDVAALEAATCRQ